MTNGQDNPILELVTLDESSGVPIWLQLRNRLLYLIKAGSLKEGDRLPTVREMAVALGINYNTVSKVYQDVEKDGFIASKRGRGTFVLRPPVAVKGPDQAARHLAEEFVRQCKEIGVPEGDIAELVRQAIDGVHPVAPRVIVGKGGLRVDEESAEGA